MPKLIHSTSKIVLALVLITAVGCAPRQPSTQSLESSAPPASPATQQADSSDDTEDFLANLSLDYSFVKPTLGPISSKYGMRRHPTKRRTSFHQGIDINIKRGTAVMAAAPGKVVFTGVKSSGYGKTVDIEHPGGFLTRYAHLDSITVKPGDKVDSHIKIGTVGRTGRTTGPNLHFEVLAKGKTVNPLPLIAGTRDMSAPVSPYADNSQLQFFKDHPADMVRESSSRSKSKVKATTSMRSKSNKKSTKTSSNMATSKRSVASKNKAVVKSTASQQKKSTLNRTRATASKTNASKLTRSVADKGKSSGQTNI